MSDDETKKKLSPTLDGPFFLLAIVRMLKLTLCLFFAIRVFLLICVATTMMFPLYQDLQQFVLVPPRVFITQDVTPIFSVTTGLLVNFTFVRKFQHWSRGTGPIWDFGPPRYFFFKQ